MVNAIIPRVTHIHIKQFRCFNERIITFDAPIVLIQGANGAGKTSLLEALYYACYLRSFRASTPRELVADTAKTFFIKVLMQGIDTQDEIHIGFSYDKRLVKINQQAIASYKELMSYYRVIAITEDDIDLIKEGPSYRRDFLDQGLALFDPAYVATSKQMRDTLEKRNAALQTGRCSEDMYTIWTQQLWERSLMVQAKRIDFLDQIQDQVNELIRDYFKSDFEVSFTYEPKKMVLQDSFTLFQEKNKDLYQSELRFKRSLFGAHLDDILISFKGKPSRAFASRGQQKLLVILMKAAQIRLLGAHITPIICLLDDFMTDFDRERSSILMQLLSDLNVQLIFTSPVGGYLEQIVQGRPFQLVNLD